MIEVLSPAGTYESFLAAVSAGADAVYLGGSMFGARAFAGNFDKEELIRAIDYAHIHGRKIYLTVNTLLKERELEDNLYEYIRPYYEEGLDAVIVQDYGVFNFIKNNFPDMDIHASTQMTVTGREGAKLLWNMGASRVVTARELKLSEIASIRNEIPDIEIESFVHGALCYCYSGQCFMSSLIGGRSGNRGRCAQACRLPYDVYKDERQINNRGEKYVLSPKDMCALNILPKVIEAGVNSLKIEGRMKSPEYTAGVVSMYRKYTDMYLERGAKGYKVDEADIEKLMDLYNRGSFTDGYYTENTGVRMMSMSRPNHQGVAALKVTESYKGGFKAVPLTKLNQGDVIEIASDYEITIGAKDENSSRLEYRIPVKFKAEKGSILYRTRNAKLINSIREAYINKQPKEKLDIELELRRDMPVKLTLKAAGCGIEAYGDIVSKALNRPVTKEQMIKQISKLGETKFEAGNITINMDDDVFIPVGAVNELRRSAIVQLEEKIISMSYRKCGDIHDKATKANMNNGCGDDTSDNNADIAGSDTDSNKQYACYSALVSDKCQLKPAAKSGLFKRIYIESAAFGVDDILQAVKYIKDKGIEAYIAMPYIFRKAAEDDFDRVLGVIKDSQIDGYLVRSLCEIQYLRDNNIKRNIVTDHNMYAFNHEAQTFLKNIGTDMQTVSIELNKKEIEALGTEGMEIIGYGYYPMMVSAQCVRKCCDSCAKGVYEKGSSIPQMYLVDRKNKKLPLMSVCKYCYSFIYNESPVYLIDNMDLFRKWKNSYVRIEFTVENEKETENIINAVRNKKNIEKSNSGHFNRGVE